MLERMKTVVAKVPPEDLGAGKGRETSRKRWVRALAGGGTTFRLCFSDARRGDGKAELRGGVCLGAWRGARGNAYIGKKK